MHATHCQDGVDADLLAAVASGETPAFERLYKLYEQRVYQYVCTLVYDTALAEEILADTMLAVWQAAGSFARTSRVSTWIFGIARHKALDSMRRMGRRQRETTLDDATDLIHPQESPIETVHRRQMADVTHEALTQLSPEHQEVLRLVFYEELPYDEIATVLSIPENTVKTRVYYAKQRLKQQLTRQDKKEPV